MSEMAEHLDAARERLKAQTPTAPYLTKAEAAELARCNPKTVQRAIHSGRLRAFRPAGRVLLLESDVRAWIESQAATAAPAEPPRPGRHPRRRVKPGSPAAIREIERQLS